MNAPEQPVQFTPRWQDDGSHRIPFGVYTDAALHQREMERFFYRGHWSYVGLEAEIPKPGDFKRTAVGERSVILLRDNDGHVRVVENVCAHRGVQFCRERAGNRSEFVCPYHQWNYDLQGNLIGVPFRRGVKQDGKINGGMPRDFKPEEHGLTKLAWPAATAWSSPRSTTTWSPWRTTSARTSCTISTVFSTVANS